MTTVMDIGGKLVLTLVLLWVGGEIQLVDGFRGLTNTKSIQIPRFPLLTTQSQSQRYCSLTLSPLSQTSLIHSRRVSRLRTSGLQPLHARKPKAATTADSGSSDSSGPADGAPVVVNKRNEVLNSVLGNIERCYGRGSIQKLGEAPKMNVETFSSGSVTLDHALGGGYPRGRVIEIYGPESSGKTTLALHAIAELQRLNGAACHTVIRIFESGLTCKYFSAGTAAFIDAEHALDPVYARHLGVNIDDLLVSQPDSGEMALDVVDQLVRSSAVDVVVVDSVAALVPRVELEGSPLKHFSTMSACNDECFCG
jgi:hypothetical protein